MRRIVLILLLGTLLGCSAAAIRDQPALFEFHSNFWLNLHHYLRVVGRGQPEQAAMTAAERAVWNQAVAVYRADYSQRDLFRDDSMIAIKSALRGAAGRPSLEGVDIPGDLRDALERAAPLYRRYHWPEHDAANRSWIENAQDLVRRYGSKIAPRVAAAYGETWPAGPIDVDLVPSAGPDGAYTTSPPAHVSIASIGHAGNRGLPSLELLFHESSHQWGRRLARVISGSAEKRGKQVPRGLWHAVLFYNAEEITRRVLADNGVEYGGYAGADVYRDLCGEGCRDRVVAAWNPRLDGSVSMEEALDRLVASF